MKLYVLFKKSTKKKLNTLLNVTYYINITVLLFFSFYLAQLFLSSADAIVSLFWRSQAHELFLLPLIHQLLLLFLPSFHHSHALLAPLSLPPDRRCSVVGCQRHPSTAVDLQPKNLPGQVRQQESLLQNLL